MNSAISKVLSYFYRLDLEESSWFDPLLATLISALNSYEILDLPPYINAILIGYSIIVIKWR